MIADHVGRLPPNEACEALINAAIAAGAPDNVSVGVFRMMAVADQPDREGSAGSAHTTTRRLDLADENSTSPSSAHTRKLDLAHHGALPDA
jgi:serine/threonine protein phosphatase PrpC